MRCFTILLVLVLGCDPTTGGPRRDGGTRDVGPGVDSGPGGFDAGPRPDAGPRVDTGLMECSAVSVEAMESFAPVDIVWVVDNSGSMRGEADNVQANLNDFAMTIAAAGLDIHVVLITAPGYVEVPPPLGTDPERFLRVGQDVQSHNALDVVIASFPMYESFLRRSANLHFIGVTDDESAMPGTAFESTMRTMLGRTFQFHSIVSPPGSRHTAGGFFEMDGCEGPDDDAADNGDEYWALSARTGGLQLSICTRDWSGLFASLSRAIAVAETLPCVYEIPDPPEGETFDPGRVNVAYTPGGGGAQEYIPFVESGDRCAGEGWYYEGSPPERVLLCPTTCSRIESDATGRIDLAFGCATLLL